MMMPQMSGAKLTRPAMISQIPIVLTRFLIPRIAGLPRSARNLSSVTARMTKGTVKMIPTKVSSQKNAARQLQMAEMSRGVVIMDGASMFGGGGGGPAAVGASRTLGMGTIVRSEQAGHSWS